MALPVSHDTPCSGKKNRGVNQFQTSSTLLVLSSVTHTSQPHSQPRDNRTYTLTILRDFKISKIRARHRLGNVETSLACASDYVLESN